ncbi:MAG: sugar phosphate nucleotidyltransferase [Lutibacter sp.]|nr:sugar phosphate nucleotidyltransferase [Lutibacter sp.]
MSKPTLVILAAGVGSRYGGLKQLDTFSAQGDTILDFSIYDAIQAGFGKVVFVIRKEIETDFKLFFDQRLRGKIAVEYVFQEVDYIPEPYKGQGREKPWGTGHALLMAKEVVQENFAVINADDFYGRAAFKGLADALTKTDCTKNDFYMMGYVLKNTLSPHGFVSRGESQVNAAGYLTGITERTHIERIDGLLSYKDQGGNFVPIAEDTIVSMNCFGFRPQFFDFLASLFDTFLAANYKDPKAEFFIPLVVNHLIMNSLASLRVLSSDARWFGVTYREDKAYVESAIQQLKDDGTYPANLWE